MQFLATNNPFDFFKPYLRLARLDRPVGIWLLFFPSLWGLALASSEPFSFELATFLLVGSVLIRSAGCTYNDLVDRKFDKKVARTAHRPLASGELSPKQGSLFLGTLLLPAFLVLLQFPNLSILFGLGALPLIFFYPWMKRITYWPQIFLGATMNWGIFIGWTAVNESLTLPVYTLFLGAALWTLGYDTIYAHQDKKDDVLVGVKSSALRIKSQTPWFLFFIYGFSILLFVITGIMKDLSWPYYLSLSFIVLSFLKQALKTDFHSSKSCLKSFKENQWVGLILFLGIIFGK